MGVVVRQGFKGTVAIYIGALIGGINLLWVFPKFLKPEEIGLVRVFLEMGLLFALLSQFGTSSIADKFFTFFNDHNKKHQGFLLLLLSYSTFGFLIISLIYILSYQFWIDFYKQKSSLIVHYLLHVIPLTLLIMYSNILEAYSRVHMRIVIPTAIREVFLRLAQTAIVLLYYYQIISLNALIYFLIISYLLGMVLIVVYLKRLGRFYLSWINFLQKKDLVKEMVIYGTYIFLGTAAGVIAFRIDLIMLTGYSGLSFAGIYSISFFIAAVIEIPKRSISKISAPLIAQFWKSKELNKIEEIFKKTAINQLIIGLALFLLIWCNVDLIFDLMPKSEIYRAGKYVILYIAISRLVDMGTGVSGEILVTSPIYKFNLVLTIISGSSIILLNYYLIPSLGMDGAAISVMINFILTNIISVLIIYFKFNIHPFEKKYLLAILSAILTFGVISVMPKASADTLVLKLFNITVNSFVILLLFIGMVYILKISEDFNKLLQNLFAIAKSLLGHK